MEFALLWESLPKSVRGKSGLHQIPWFELVIIADEKQGSVFREDPKSIKVI